jgi:BarA-like signal transduction histidine kinase
MASILLSSRTALHHLDEKGIRLPVESPATTFQPMCSAAPACKCLSKPIALSRLLQAVPRVCANSAVPAGESSG